MPGHSLPTRTATSRVPGLKSEDKAKILIHLDGEASHRLSLERVQPQARRIQLPGMRRGIQQGQYQIQARSVLTLDFARASRTEKLLQALVLEALDHAPWSVP